jgi:hypothetical protein
MAAAPRDSLKVSDILRAANKHYAEGYLSTYFADRPSKVGEDGGDTLAEFIVSELRETFVRNSPSKQQVAVAVRVLERAMGDLQKAIDGLQELRPRSASSD